MFPNLCPLGKGGCVGTSARWPFFLLMMVVCLGFLNLAGVQLQMTSPERKNVKKQKSLGQVFTPENLVAMILDFAGYTEGPHLLKRHIIDNSCGDGAFLLEIARRYCASYFLEGEENLSELAYQLSTFVHGIEIDASICQSCVCRLDAFAKELGLPSVDWDVRCADAMTVVDFNGRMDFVVGNPPYVRVHNLKEDFSRVKKFDFCDGGMTDLYFVFYEIGLRMLSPEGRLCYITPSSWMSSVAGRRMRAYLYQKRCLMGVIDLEHFQPFKATTYTSITLLGNERNDGAFIYGCFDGVRGWHKMDYLTYDDAFVDGSLFLADKSTLHWFRNIKTSKVPSRVSVKNGFATLSDSVFIADAFPFTNCVIPIVKASTGKLKKAFYPYDENGRPLRREDVFRDSAIAKYLEERKSVLLKGRSETVCEDWYLYGRTQALKDVQRDKYAIGSVVRDLRSIKFNRAPTGTGVYGGLYIVSSVDEHLLRRAIYSDDFIRYVKILRKYKSGGYYTFSSGELERFLNYKLETLCQTVE